MKNPIQYYYAPSPEDYLEYERQENKCKNCDYVEKAENRKEELNKLKLKIENAPKNQKEALDLIDKIELLKEENQTLKRKIEQLERRFNDMGEHFKEVFLSFSYDEQKTPEKH